MMYTCTRRMMFILADFEKEFFIMRASGILLPVSSLPSKYGIGCFSKSAFEWIDFLQESGQTFWQILPLGPTSYGDSPYQSFSTFAGNPYFISLEELIKEGLLTREECEAAQLGTNPSYVDYGKQYENRNPISLSFVMIVVSMDPEGITALIITKRRVTNTTAITITNMRIQLKISFRADLFFSSSRLRLRV